MEVETSSSFLDVGLMAAAMKDHMYHKALESNESFAERMDQDLIINSALDLLSDQNSSDNYTTVSNVMNPIPAIKITTPERKLSHTDSDYESLGSPAFSSSLSHRSASPLPSSLTSSQTASSALDFSDMIELSSAMDDAEARELWAESLQDLFPVPVDALIN